MSDGPVLASGDLRGTVLRPGPRERVLSLSGVGDTESKEALRDFLLDAHRSAVRDGAREVCVDWLRLEFLNSSCLKAFLTWINEIRSTPGCYAVRLRLDPASYWQRRSAEALVGFGGDEASIAVDG